MLFLLSGLSDLPPAMLFSAMVGFLLALLIGMTIHEWAHSYVAHLMGDPTPKSLGRLTLNPFVHIYLPGFIMALLIGFGTLGTAPINPYRMRNPRLGYFLAVAAGPFSNLGVAIIGALLYRFIDAQFMVPNGSEMWVYIQFGLSYFIIMNLLMFLFNLIPLAPLDGWSMVYTLLPPREAIWWERNRQNSQTAFFLLIFVGYAIPQLNLLSIIIFEPLGFLLNLLMGR